jgi:hypothetical protein
MSFTFLFLEVPYKGCPFKHLNPSLIYLLTCVYMMSFWNCLTWHIVPWTFPLLEYFLVKCWPCCISRTCDRCPRLLHVSCLVRGVFTSSSLSSFLVCDVLLHYSDSLFVSSFQASAWYDKWMMLSGKDVKISSWKCFICNVLLPSVILSFLNQIQVCNYIKPRLADLVTNVSHCL